MAEQAEHLTVAEYERANRALVKSIERAIDQGFKSQDQRMTRFEERIGNAVTDHGERLAVLESHRTPERVKALEEQHEVREEVTKSTSRRTVTWSTAGATGALVVFELVRQFFVK